MTVKQDRSLLILILLSLVTCGIYQYYFWYKFAEDMNIVCRGDGDETTGGATMILLFIFTCGIYPYIWYYSAANRLQANSRRYGYNFPESGTTVLLWLLLGALIVIGPFIGMHILIKNMNALAMRYNESNGDGYNGGGYDNGGYNGGGYDNGGYNGGGYDNGGYNGGGYDNGGYNGGYDNGGYNGGGYDNGGANGFRGNQGVLPRNNESYDTSNYPDTLPMDLPPISKPRGASLTCVSGELSGAVYQLNAGSKLVIGRDGSCNIKFSANTPNVSRVHCTVEYDGSAVWLTDNNSTFGTYLQNGMKLAPHNRVQIRTGDGFYLGSPNILFRL